MRQCVMILIALLLSLTMTICNISSLENFMAYSDGIAVLQQVEDSTVEKVFCQTGNDFPYTQEEIDLLALLTMAEAEGECEYGQRLVIDTVLNRVDHPNFPNTIYDVVYQKNQYEGMQSPRINRCFVKEEFQQLVYDRTMMLYSSERKDTAAMERQCFGWNITIFQAFESEEVAR